MSRSDKTAAQTSGTSPQQSTPGDSIPPALTLVATPIGNLGDISQRALDVLRSVDVLLCEDTRTTARLLDHYGIRVRTEALHDHNEDVRTPGLVARMVAGERFAMVSDAGTPVFSDPGFRLVRASIAAGLPVEALPGPNAAVTAVILSGLPPAPFLFLGFPPPKHAARRHAFAQIRAAETAGLAATLVWYEAPHRLADMLSDATSVFGDRDAAIVRELTKRFEEVRRGTLSALVAGLASDPPRGEITVVLGPASEEPTEVNLDALLLQALAQGSLRDAAANVAQATGLPRKAVYARAIELSSGLPPNAG